MSRHQLSGLHIEVTHNNVHTSIQPQIQIQIQIAIQRFITQIVGTASGFVLEVLIILTTLDQCGLVGSDLFGDPTFLFFFDLLEGRII